MCTVQKSVLGTIDSILEGFMYFFRASEGAETRSPCFFRCDFRGADGRRSPGGVPHGPQRARAGDDERRDEG